MTVGTGGHGRGVPVGVAEGVGSGCELLVTLGLTDLLIVGVRVAVRVGVRVGVFVGVAVPQLGIGVTGTHS